MKKILSLLVLFLFVYGCSTFLGDEILRISLDKFSTKDPANVFKDSIDLRAGDKLNVWSDMDIEFEGIAQIQFQVYAIRDQKENFGLIKFDAFRKMITVGETKASDGNNAKWRFQGKMGSMSFEYDGNYAFNVIMIANDPEKIKVNKADIVFRK